MVFRKFKTKNRQKMRLKVCYFNDRESGTKKWQAIFLNIGRTTYWLFRNRDIYNGWPSATA